MPQEDEDTAEMDHAEEVFERVLPPNHESAEMLEPGKQPLDFPAATVPPERPTVLGVTFAAAVVRCNPLNTPLGQFGIELVGIVRVISDEAPDRFGNDDLGEGPPDQGHFVRRSAFRANGERKTSTVCHCHDLGPFAALGFSPTRAPLFAGAKLPSMKASCK
jgi:hypothetical protein